MYCWFADFSVTAGRLALTQLLLQDDAELELQASDLSAADAAATGAVQIMTRPTA